MIDKSISNEIDKIRKNKADIIGKAKLVEQKMREIKNRDNKKNEDCNSDNPPLENPATPSHFIS